MNHQEVSPTVQLEVTLGEGEGPPPPHTLAGLGSGARLQEPGLRGTPWSGWVGRVHVQSVGIWRLISTPLREKGRKTLGTEP